MPILFPTGIAMAFELATYGFVIGFLYSHSRWQCIISLYRCMIVSLIAGRIVWGIVMMIIVNVSSNVFTLQMFLSAALLNAIPGIILQLVLIPSVMLALHKTGLVPFRSNTNYQIEG